MPSQPWAAWAASCLALTVSVSPMSCTVSPPLTSAVLAPAVASMSAILPTENYKVFFGDTDVTTKDNGDLTSPGLTSNLQGGVTAAMPGGSFLGAIVSGYIADKVGRRQAIMIASVIFIIGSIITCASQAIAMLVVGRLICGECAVGSW